MITPHFPPDSSAGAHRVRLLAPHLEEFGWKPTVLTVDPAFMEGIPDPKLAALVPEDLRVERSSAFPVDMSRRFGIGDLGLRSLKGLHAKAVELLSRERYDALFITIYPAYTALLGPRLKRRFKIPFVLDYQDPWVGAWGDTVGGGSGEKVDFKSKTSRRVGLVLEPHVVKSADAITAVSAKTIDAVIERIPRAAGTPRFTIPIGGDERDFESVRSLPDPKQFFDRADGLFHLCHVGTILPLGQETLRAFLSSVAAIRDTRPDLYQRIRIHFLGTSNERVAGASARVLGHAAELGISDIVSEHPTRIDYTDALQAQLHASALLLMGSSEHHYTASRLYPAMLARRPLLAIYHRLSSVTAILGDHEATHIKLVQFGDDDRPRAHSDEIANALVSLIEADGTPVDTEERPMDESFSARHLAGVLAGAFDRVAAAHQRSAH